MCIRYFTDESYHPTALVRRRAEHRDDAFVNGRWRPTNSIVDFMAGKNDFVDEVSESEARQFAPAAFIDSS